MGLIIKDRDDGEFGVPYDEDDSDQGFSPFPEFCLMWPCNWDKKKLVKNERGFWCCPKCGVSYGRKT